MNKPEPSLGGIWSDTWLELPATAPTEYQELFCQCRVNALPAEGHLRLYLHDTFEIFPFAFFTAHFD
jgi:hypothetical protein